MSLDWFQLTPIPADAMGGSFHLGFVTLSYVIAVLASYVALDLAGQLRLEQRSSIKLYWLLGGAVAMGAGIWSMHFIGMLAFVMPMPSNYDLKWTIASLLMGILASGFALFLLQTPGRSVIYLGLGGIFLGLAICSMHYMGMEGMAAYMNIHYLPGLFFLSILIAIVASEVAIWLMLQSNQGSFQRQLHWKMMSALVMGAAICGMHYTGMAAAIFTPLQHPAISTISIEPFAMAFYIAGVTGLIITIALIVSIYKQLMVSAVQEEKNFLNTMLDNLSDGILACDINGKITVFNQALRKILNLPEGIITLSELTNTIDWHQADTGNAISPKDMPLTAALNGQRIQKLELTLILQKSLERIVVVDGQAIVNNEGKTLGAVIVLHDITSSKQVEQRLVQSEKMAVVGQLATGIAHELNQPLSIIRLNLQTLNMLLKDTISDQDMSEIIHTSVDQVDRAAKIIGYMRTLAGKKEKIRETVNLNSLLDEALHLFKEQHELEGIEIIRNFDTNAPRIALESASAKQLIVNLLANAQYAVKKMRAKSDNLYTMMITLNLKYNQEKHQFILEVCDNGIGMEKETLDHCLEPFYTGKEIGEGAGLGLTVVYNTVKTLDGSIDIKSTLNQGTSITIVLPENRENELLSNGVLT